MNTVIYLSEINLSMLESFQEGDVILMSREEILEVTEQLCRLLKYEFIFVPVSDFLFRKRYLSQSMTKLTKSHFSGSLHCTVVDKSS